MWTLSTVESIVESSVSDHKQTNLSSSLFRTHLNTTTALTSVATIDAVMNPASKPALSGVSLFLDEVPVTNLNTHSLLYNGINRI